MTSPAAGREFAAGRSSLRRIGPPVRQDGWVLDASSVAGPAGGYGWLLVLLAVIVVVSIVRRLVRLALLVGLVAVAVLAWRSGVLAG